ncbi:MAG: hypothetical protein ACHQ9S_00065 [Candidatus Binatia bacterium]
MKITWKHSDSDFGSPLSFDDKVTIFRERIWGWYLYIAELCINGGQVHDGSARVHPIPHSGYGVLSLTLSYFETIGKHVEGYTNHSSQTMPGIFLSGAPGTALIFDPAQKHLLINPHLIPKKLVDHLDAYCTQLRAGTDPRLRKNFEARFDYELS